MENIGGDSERPSVQLLCRSHPVVSTKTVNDVDVGGNANESISMSKALIDVDGRCPMKVVLLLEGRCWCATNDDEGIMALSHPGISRPIESKNGV